MKNPPPFARARKPVALLTITCAALFALMLGWRALDRTPDDFYRPIEENLDEALQRLREASVADRRADASLASGVLVLAEALAESSNARQKHVADAAKKEVGVLLFADDSSTKAITDGSATSPGQISPTPDLIPAIVPYPGPLPGQLFTPLPLLSYVGTYAGTIVGRPVNFVVTITNRNLLGIRIAGLDVQPALEFAELEPQKFIRPDARAVAVFTGRTSEGFRTLVFQQKGIEATAENILFAHSGSK